jgi:hypothetical protein
VLEEGGVDRESGHPMAPVDDRDGVYYGTLDQDRQTVDGGVLGCHAQDLLPDRLDLISDVAERRPQRGHYLAGDDPVSIAHVLRGSPQQEGAI